MQGVSPDRGERKERSRPGAKWALRVKAGTIEGYSYSPANKNSGITWDEATFREYIKDPRAKVPGTKMTFPGLKDPKQIDDIVAYLKQFDSTGKKTAGIVPAGRNLAKVQ
jgi:cytochrome c